MNATELLGALVGAGRPPIEIAKITDELRLVRAELREKLGHEWAKDEKAGLLMLAVWQGRKMLEGDHATPMCTCRETWSRESPRSTSPGCPTHGTIAAREQAAGRLGARALALLAEYEYEGGTVDGSSCCPDCGAEKYAHNLDGTTSDNPEPHRVRSDGTPCEWGAVLAIHRAVT